MDGKKQRQGSEKATSRPAEEDPRNSRESRKCWSRARRPDEKQQRRAAILTAAISLLDEEGIEAAKLSAIARAAKISKANLYRYFESREDILLTVAIGDAEDWLAAVQRELAALSGSANHEALIEVLVRSACTRPRLCALVSSLSSVLEHNVSSERIAAFKRRFHALMQAPIASLVAVEARLSPEDALRFMTHFYVFIAGAWPMTHPPAAVCEVLTRPEFAGFALEFDAVLRDHAQLTLIGLLAD